MNVLVGMGMSMMYDEQKPRICKLYCDTKDLSHRRVGILNGSLSWDETMRKRLGWDFGMGLRQKIGRGFEAEHEIAERKKRKTARVLPFS